MSLELKNPHSVLAAIQTRPHDVFDVNLMSDAPSPAWTEVLDVAAASAVRVTRQGRSGRAAVRGGETSGRETLMSASVRERRDVSLEELFGRRLGLRPDLVQSSDPVAGLDLVGTESQPTASGLWLALDNLQDTHNVGAIFRTAAFFGVRGIVVTKDRSAPMNATVYDVAAGGVEHVPFTLVPNLARAIGIAKESGLWVLGTSEHATEEIWQIDRDRPWLLIVGNEESGMRRLTAEHCDTVCRIAPRGEVTSLNVSVATGIMIAALRGK